MCKMRHKAIAAGFDLPPSYNNQLKKESKQDQGSLKSYFGGPSFTVDLINMILVIWVVRHALPWTRFEDPALRAAFYAVNRGATVRSKTWAAKQSVILYAGLHDKAINTIKVRLFNFITSSFFEFHFYPIYLYHDWQLKLISLLTLKWM